MNYFFICHQRSFRRLAFTPQNIAGFEVKTDKKTTLVTTSRAIQTTVNDDHPAVVVAHMIGEIDFFGLDLTIGILAQFYGAPAALLRAAHPHL
jgi:uncharacterized ferritin-like protein (DUF455 family)